MRIAVTGQHGQVAMALQALGEREGVEVISLARPECDLADLGSVGRAVRRARPNVVVNAAAWTAVDKAEAERDMAFRVNAAGAGAVAAAAAAIGAPIIHLSTDYVFDGRKGTPYVETDATGPASAYGASKLAGEQQVAAATWNHAILRVAWLYSPWGTNFLRTMLRLAETREEIGVVDDQIGNPTSALAVAEGILIVARNLVDEPDAGDLRGVFHMTASGEASWAGFARAIFAQAAVQGLPAARVRPITTADYPTPAARPASSRLASELIELRHGVRLPPWQESVAETLGILAGEPRP
jgi:dTDP-4-dehydrorhamnose reductase